MERAARWRGATHALVAAVGLGNVELAKGGKTGTYTGKVDTAHGMSRHHRMSDAAPLNGLWVAR